MRFCMVHWRIWSASPGARWARTLRPPRPRTRNGIGIGRRIPLSLFANVLPKGTDVPEPAEPTPLISVLRLSATITERRFADLQRDDHR
jgi:hypothetical protein